MQVESDCFELYNKDVRVKAEGAVDAKVVLTFNTRTLFVSDEHESLFLKPLLWPVNDSKFLLKLRKVKGRSREAKTSPLKANISIQGEIVQVSNEIILKCLSDSICYFIKLPEGK